MFYRCLGNYLLAKKVITGVQLAKLVEYRKNNRLKLGYLAVEKKMMSMSAANEINNLQMTMDKRFGDLAVEKGYLTKKQLDLLLKLQGNPYFLFVQAVTELLIMTRDEVDAFLLEFQRERNLSDAEIEALKGGDIEKSVQILLKVEGEANQIVSLAIRNIIRFISTDIAIGSITYINKIKFAQVACQTLTGDFVSLFGYGSDNNELLSIAIPYAKEEFNTCDADAMDAVCEFINCTNGLFASKLSLDNVELELLPPECSWNVEFTSEQNIMVLPLQIDGQWLSLFLLIKSEWKVQQL